MNYEHTYKITFRESELEEGKTRSEMGKAFRHFGLMPVTIQLVETRRIPDPVMVRVGDRLLRKGALDPSFEICGISSLYRLVWVRPRSACAHLALVATRTLTFDEAQEKFLVQRNGRECSIEGFREFKETSDE